MRGLLEGFGDKKDLGEELESVESLRDLKDTLDN